LINGVGENKPSLSHACISVWPFFIEGKKSEYPQAAILLVSCFAFGWQIKIVHVACAIGHMCPMQLHHPNNGNSSQLHRTTTWTHAQLLLLPLWLIVVLMHLLIPNFFFFPPVSMFICKTKSFVSSGFCERRWWSSSN